MSHTPILGGSFPETVNRWGVREVQMAGRPHLTLRQYRALEAGERRIDYDLTCVVEQRLQGLRSL